MNLDHGKTCAISFVTASVEPYPFVNSTITEMKYFYLFYYFVSRIFFSSGADIVISLNNPFIGGQFFYSHWSSGVQSLSRNCHLCTQSQL